MNNNQIIDIEAAGNLLHLHLGTNGSQWGDDWEKLRYEHNAGVVYPEYVSRTVDVVYPIEMVVLSYTEYNHMTNSNRSKLDFVNRKSPFYYVILKASPWLIQDEIYMGDTLSQHPLMRAVR